MNSCTTVRVLSPSEGQFLTFIPVALHFLGDTYADVFAQKNNKTLGETLLHPRYASVAKKITLHAVDLDRRLGDFLIERKRAGDNTYRKFLNRYGDLVFSTFRIADPTYRSRKGVYAYYVGQDLKYLGRCRDSMGKRIDQGYGKIHPKNCYIDGQATNCHLNSLITERRDSITLWLCPMDSDDEIERTEVRLLRAYDPPWNIQKP